MPEPRRAVIDRIVDGVVVLITEPDDREHHLHATRLPAGAREGSVVFVERQGDGLVVIAVDEDETARRHADARQRLDDLRTRRSSGRFGSEQGGR